MTARRLLPLMGLLAANLVIPTVAAGQGNLTMTVTPTVVAFDSPGVPELDAGWVDHAGVVVAIRSRPPNRLWELRIRAMDVGMGQGKPVTDMLWRLAGTGPWTPLTATETAVVQGTGDQNVALEFRVLLDWAGDGPGTYSANFDFTVLRP
jgi:hypothetical protein